MADTRLRSLERMLRAEGIRYKVLDERAIERLSGFLSEELRKAHVEYNGFPTGPQNRAIAFERMNNIASLMELIL